MGLGWVQVDYNAPLLCFKSRTPDWPSSTRAEAMAIILALFTCPHRCKVNIYTDSQCCVNTFKKCTMPAYNKSKIKACMIGEFVMYSVIILNLERRQKWHKPEILFR